MDEIIIEHLTKHYGERLILNDINLTFDSNEGLIILLGASGSGKSTFFNCLCGFDTFEGRIMFNNNENQETNNVSMMFQNFELFDYLTVFENIKFGLINKNLKEEDKKKLIDENLKLFNIEKLKNHKVSTLSGGEKQRVALVKAIISNPRVLLCDEPTGSLDERNSEEVFGFLKNEATKRLVIVITHNQRLAKKYGDSIYELKNQQITLKNQKKFICSSKNQKSLETKKVLSCLKYFGLKNFACKLLMILILAFSYLSLFFVSSISTFCNSDFDLQHQQYGDYNILKIDAIDESDNNLAIVKPSRLSESEIKINIGTYKYKLDFSFEKTFAEASIYLDDKKNDNIRLLPMDNNEIQDFSLVALNDLAHTLIANKKITLKCQKKIIYHGEKQNLQEEIKIDTVLKINKVIKEPLFLNDPIIYYSYQAAKKFFNSVQLTKFKSYFGKNISFYDTLNLVNCSTYTESLLIFTEKLETQKIYQSLNDKKLSKTRKISVQSRAITSATSLAELLHSFEQMLIIFKIMAIICTIFITFLLFINNLHAFTKEIGIMKTTLIKHKVIENSFLYEFILFEIIALIISLLVKNSLFNVVEQISIKTLNLNLVLDYQIISLQSIELCVFILILLVMCKLTLKKFLCKETIYYLRDSI